MDQYDDYTLHDFIQDELFVQWVKYPDPQTNGFWESVRKTHPHQSAVMDQAAEVAAALATFYPEVPDSEIEKGRQAVLKPYTRNKIAWFSRSRLSLSVAASVVLLLGFALWFGSGVLTTPSLQIPLTGSPSEIHTSNEGIDPKLITLPDGSTIALSPHSSVTYEMNGRDSRLVHLQGEALFTVTRNVEKPFFVLANGLTTKVLGTSFKVSAYPDGDEVKVEVSSGRVRVYSHETGTEDPEAGGLTLTPNQQAVYRKKDLQLTRMIVEKPQVLVTEEELQAYTYTDTPIAKIFEGLEDIYGIKVVYDQEKFKNCRLNMALSDESLFEKLELIGKVVEARYNIIDGQVIFIGEGCGE